MDEHTAYEQAYKNGYEKGRQDALKWIPVTERLPEDNQDVLGYMQNSIESRIFPASYYKGRWEDCIWNVQCLSVTHWMPLPPAPKGE